MRRNAQLSERGKVRTKALVQDEEAELKLANQEAAAQRATEAAEAFANRSRAVTFLPASMDATLDIPADEASAEEEAAKAFFSAHGGVSLEDDYDSPTKEAAWPKEKQDAYQEKLSASLLVR